MTDEIEEDFSLYPDPRPTHGTVKRSPFLHLTAHRSGHVDSVHYVAADSVQWVEQIDGGRVLVRFHSGDELITRAEPVALCAHIEAALTQRMTYGCTNA